MAWDFSGCAVTVEIAPDSSLFAAAPTWVDITSDVRSIPSLIRSGRTSELEQTQPGTAEIVVNNRSRTFDPAYGPASVTFNGTATNYFDAGDKAAFAAASQLDVRAALYLSDWTPAANQAIIGQYGAAGNRSWYVSINTSGYLQLVTSNDGTATTSRDSGVRVSAVDGQAMCVRVTWTNAGAGTTTYYVKRTTVERLVQECQSDDGWVALGSADAGTTTTLFNSTAGVRVGELGDGTGTLNGRVYYASAATTINGTPAVTFWPKDAASTSATSWTSSATGETWTGTGSAYVVRIQGTYYGRLLPGTPIRVSATYSASTRRLWYGYIRRVVQSYPSAGTDAVARIIASDALGWLADRACPDSPIGVEIAKYGADVANYWPLHDDPATLHSYDKVGTSHAWWSGYGASGYPLQSWAGVPTKALVAGLTVQSTTPASSDTDTYPQIGALVWIEDEASIFAIAVGDAANQYFINYGFGGVYYIQAINSGVSTYGYIAGRLTPGAHVIRFVDNTVAITAADFSDSAGDAYTQATESGSLSASLANTRGVYVAGVGATVSDVLLYNGTNFLTTAANRDAFYRTALNGRALDTAGVRMQWYLDAAGVPSGLYSITSDADTYLGPAGSGGSYLSQMLAVNAAEFGRLYVTGAGVVTFKSKVSTLTATASTTSQATFSDSFVDITMQPADASDVINVCEVSMPSGSKGEYRDTASIDLYGEKPRNFSAPCASSGDAQSLASYIVRLRAHPRTRVASVTLLPRSAPATLFPQVLDRELGDRITIIRNVTSTLRPAVTTEPITADCWIEGIQHSMDAQGNWTTTWLTVPPAPTAAEAGYLTLDDSVLGNLDAAISLAP